MENAQFTLIFGFILDTKGAPLQNPRPITTEHLQKMLKKYVSYYCLIHLRGPSVLASLCDANTRPTLTYPICIISYHPSSSYKLYKMIIDSYVHVAGIVNQDFYLTLFPITHFARPYLHIRSANFVPFVSLRGISMKTYYVYEQCYHTRSLRYFLRRRGHNSDYIGRVHRTEFDLRRCLPADNYSSRDYMSGIYADSYNGRIPPDQIHRQHHWYPAII